MLVSLHTEQHDVNVRTMFSYIGYKEDKIRCV